MNNYFILLAAGKGKRFNERIPKQFTMYKGKMMFEHSINKAIKSGLFKKIIMVISNSQKIYLQGFKNKKVIIINGGKERFNSSFNGLKYIRKFNPQNVFIHDAARPNFRVSLLRKIKNNLKNFDGVVPYNKPINSIKLKNKNKIYNLNRESIYETQTPQCFNFDLIYNLSKINKKKITDECSLLIDKGYKLKFIKGELLNNKITYKDNLNKIFYGIGWDVHRLVPKRKLYLGGIKIASKYGTLGHSDGDPVLHSVTDSILGACGLNDIGNKFSDKSVFFKNIRSTILLKRVINEIKEKNYVINNIDINIIAQKPKIQKYKNRMINIISKKCEINKKKINIKGKTTEKLGVIGKELAIACEVITSVYKND